MWAIVEDLAHALLLVLAMMLMLLASELRDEGKRWHSLGYIVLAVLCTLTVVSHLGGH